MPGYPIMYGGHRMVQEMPVKLLYHLWLCCLVLSHKHPFMMNQDNGQSAAARVDRDGVGLLLGPSSKPRRVMSEALQVYLGSGTETFSKIITYFLLY